MRQHFRPYTMTVLASDPTVETVVDLKDTSGNALACNFIEVTLSGNANRNLEFHRVSFDPPGITTPHANSETIQQSIKSAGSQTSAMPCVYTAVGLAPAVLVTSDADRVSKIYIQCPTTTTGATNEVIYIVRYGQVSVGSNLRDQERPKGL